MDEMRLPETPEEPIAPPVEENPEELAEMANRLFEAATKLQRDAEALVKAIRKEEAPLEETPIEKMTPEESEAANKAILGM